MYPLEEHLKLSQKEISIVTCEFLFHFMHMDQMYH